jgi:hypothetical protein
MISRIGRYLTDILLTSYLAPLLIALRHSSCGRGAKNGPQIYTEQHGRNDRQRQAVLTHVLIRCHPCSSVAATPK